jgi:Lrp/AsnC family leucine-responsive transcriptional regulator
MRELDDTDRNILQLLLEDGRRPYSEIAEEVGVSPPTVSDRVERLQRLGIISRFTLDLDRSLFDDGLEVLLDVHLDPEADPEVADRLAAVEGVERVYTTADRRLTVEAIVEDPDVRSLLSAAVDMAVVERYEVSLLTDVTWTPHVGEGTLSMPCDECGDEVTGDGVVAEYEDGRRHFCTQGCRERFEDRTRVVESA